MGDSAPLEAPRSSLENFLDEYLLIRLALGLIGLAMLGVIALMGRWDTSMVPFLLALGVVVLHSAWCRARQVRAPYSLVFLDVTVWGSTMVFGDDLVVATSVLVFLTLLVAMFIDGYRSLGFFAYLFAWYGVSHLAAEGVNVPAAIQLIVVLVIAAAAGGVMSRIRKWLGGLESNRSQMLGTVSHELRNSLTGMMGVTELLIGDADLDGDEAGELIEMAHQQAVDAAEIVEDLLTASRLEQSALSVASDPVDLNGEVATTVRRFRGAGTEITMHLEDGLPMVRGDGLRIRQILRNLVANAVDHGGPGMELTTRSAGSAVETVVADDGEGVPRDQERTIFLPYRRSSTGRHDAASVGLGLWICRQLAEAMGGSLRYRRSGGSTEFVLRLPVGPGGEAGGMPDREDALSGLAQN